jgi:hypothetical protein
MQPLQPRGEMQGEEVQKGTALPEQKFVKNSEMVDPTVNELPRESGITKPGNVSKNTQKLLDNVKLPKVLAAVVNAARNKELSVINIKMAMPEVKEVKTESLDEMIKVAAALFRRAYKGS